MRLGWTFIIDGTPLDTTLRPALLDTRPSKQLPRRIVHRDLKPPKIGFRP